MKMYEGLRIGSAVSLAALGLGAIWSPAAAAAVRQASDDPGNISGSWISQSFSTVARNQTGGTINPQIPKDADGNPVPLQPWANDVFKKRLAEAIAGLPTASSKGKCLPAGMPKSMEPPATLGLKIVATRKDVIVLFEEFNNYRVIHMNAEHPQDVDPGYFGNSVGHWEGKTLVVDTVGVTTASTIDSLGTPHSDAMHIVERIMRTGPNTLEDTMTIDDPKAYTKPWVMKSKLKTLPGQIGEFFCDNDRNRPDANGTARVVLAQPGQ